MMEPCRIKKRIFVPYKRIHASLASNVATRFFWRVLLRLCRIRTGIQIPVGTKIGRGFRIVHFGAIVVNPGAVIGNPGRIIPKERPTDKYIVYPVGVETTDR